MKHDRLTKSEVQRNCLHTEEQLLLAIQANLAH